MAADSRKLALFGFYSFLFWASQPTKQQTQPMLLILGRGLLFLTPIADRGGVFSKQV